jgi:hypothetical protein
MQPLFKSSIKSDAPASTTMGAEKVRTISRIAFCNPFDESMTFAPTTSSQLRERMSTGALDWA